MYWSTISGALDFVFMTRGMKDVAMIVRLCFVVACLSAGFVAADTAMIDDHTGDTSDLQLTTSSSATASRDCVFLYFSPHDSPSDRGRIMVLGYDVVATTNPADLGIDNLLNYSAVVIFLTGPGVIGSHQADLEMFVAAGGSLFIHQPNNSGRVDYAPPHLDAWISIPWGCDDVTSTYITNSTHEITLGLNDSDLSGDFDTAHTLGSGYTILARNTSCDSPALAAGRYQEGKVVFDTGFFSFYSVDPGSDEFVIRILDYLCDTGGVVAVETTSWSTIKALYH